MLPFALHGYRISVRTSTGETPFSLTYVMEDVLPVEVEVPSIGVLMEAKLSEAEWCQSRYDHQAWLNLNAWLLCVTDNYIKRGWKQAFQEGSSPWISRRRPCAQKCIIFPTRLQWQMDVWLRRPICCQESFFHWCNDSCDNGWWRPRTTCERRCSQEILCLKI